ncbi:MAG: hypothetical protein ACI4A8_04525 [Muribaculaceae bacterium]
MKYSAKKLNFFTATRTAETLLGVAFNASGLVVPSGFHIKTAIVVRGIEPGNERALRLMASASPITAYTGKLSKLSATHFDGFPAPGIAAAHRATENNVNCQ